MTTRPLSLLLISATLLLATPLAANQDAEDAKALLEPARAALANGDDNTLALSAKALKAAPDDAAANLHMALAMFWAGHFEDSARYLRRAVSARPAVLEEAEPLDTLMPADDIQPRFNEIAPLAAEGAELCFLTGAMLLVNRDRPRGLAFLLRAEELAGTDGHAGRLVDPEHEDRNLQRATAALKSGDWDDAARSFAFAALDTPRKAELFAGLAIALAADGDDESALAMLAVAVNRYSPRVLMPWLQSLEAAPGVQQAATRIAATQGAGLGHFRLASMLHFVARHYRSAREAGVQALLVNKLEDFILDLQLHMEQNDLRHDPAKPATDTPDVEPPTKPIDQPEPPAPAPTLEAARAQIRKADYLEASRILDHFTVEGAPSEVYFLQFVVLVGRGELTDASTAFQVWFQGTDDADRTRLNALRELFGRAELFDDWRAIIVDVRNADPNRGLPRMLNSYVELTRGRYSSAREELIVARIESPANSTVNGLDRILKLDEYQVDVTPGGIPDDPSPRVLMTRADVKFKEGDYDGAKTLYLRALEADRKLPFLNLSLMRVYFALGDYDNAYRQLEVLFTEQDMQTRPAQDFKLLLDAGYASSATFDAHIAALKTECEKRPLSTTPWLLYGVIQLTRGGHDVAARDALKTWHDNVRGERSAILLKMYELARRRAG